MTAQAEAKGTGNLVVSFGWCNWSSRKPRASLTRNTCLSTWLDPVFLFFLLFFFATVTLYRRSAHWNRRNRSPDRETARNNAPKNYMHIVGEMETYLKIVDNWDPSVITLITLARTNWRWYLREGAVAEGAALLMTPRGRLGYDRN